eukprot:scaffold4447_cov120-Cylindrotheca_fusiformis.AAC.6
MVQRNAFLLWLLWVHVTELCAAERRDAFGDGGSYTRIGSIPLSLDTLPSWGFGRRRRIQNNRIPSTPLGAVRSASLQLQRIPTPGVDETPKETSEELDLAVCSPIIPQDAWDRLTGLEFKNEEVVDRFAEAALKLAATENKNEWIEWTEHKDTTKLLEKKDMMSALDEGQVLVYVGKAKKDGYGSELPIVRTKSILPMSAKDMADLLMDSNRVKIYNKMSLGRQDIQQWGENTKIVRNLTKPPMTKSSMVSVTMMHSRPLKEKEQALLSGKNLEGYLVVSRAVPGMTDGNLADLPRNDILLGVNLLQDVGPDECLMTAFTHVYSPSIPKLLAQKLGVSSAINFVRDIRGACEPVAN